MFRSRPSQLCHPRNTNAHMHVTYGRLSMPWQDALICSRCADSNDIVVQDLHGTCRRVLLGFVRALDALRRV